MTALLSVQKIGKGKIALLSVQNDPDEVLDGLEPTPEKYQQLMNPILNPVINALSQGDYDTAQQKLATLFADMDDNQPAMLAKTIFVSDL